MSAPAGVHADPPSREHSKDVAVGKERRLIHASHLRDHAIDAGADLLGRLSAGATIGEDHPARSALVDLPRREPFIVAVVPLHEVAVDFGVRAKTGELTGFPSATEWAREHQVERRRRQHRRQQAGQRAAALGERNVRSTGVLAVQAPLRFAVPDQVHASHPSPTTARSSR